MTTATPPVSPPPARPAVTPDDLLKMGQQGLFELADGELIEKPAMSSLSGKTTTIISNRLYLFAQAGGLGELFTETSFRCFPNPNQVRRPDLAFVAADRLHLVPDAGHVPVRPDLAIEVVSPDDGVYDLDGKLRDYRAAGIPLVWVFNPARDIRLVRVHRPGRPIDELADADTLVGDDVLRGFSMTVGDLFPPSTGP